MKTHQQWMDSNTRSFDEFVNKYDEVDKTMYWYFLEILPPYYCANGFLVSEPYSYCSEYNTQTYSCFIEIGDKYYWLGNISPKAVEKETAILREKLAA